VESPLFIIISPPSKDDKPVISDNLPDALLKLEPVDIFISPEEVSDEEPEDIATDPEFFKLLMDTEVVIKDAFETPIAERDPPSSSIVDPADIVTDPPFCPEPASKDKEPTISALPVDKITSPDNFDESPVDN